MESLAKEVHKGGRVPLHPSSQWPFPGMLSYVYGICSDYQDKIAALTALVTAYPCFIPIEEGRTA